MFLSRDCCLNDFSKVLALFYLSSISWKVVSSTSLDFRSLLRQRAQLTLEKDKHAKSLMFFLHIFVHSFYRTFETMTFLVEDCRRLQKIECSAVFLRLARWNSFIMPIKPVWHWMVQPQNLVYIVTVLPFLRMDIIDILGIHWKSPVFPVEISVARGSFPRRTFCVSAPRGCRTSTGSVPPAMRLWFCPSHTTGSCHTDTTSALAQRKLKRSKWLCPRYYHGAPGGWKSSHRFLIHAFLKKALFGLEGSKMRFLQLLFWIDPILTYFWNDRHFLGAHAEWQDCTLQILFYNQDMLWITQSADWWITLNVYVILVGLDASNWLLFLPGCFA